MLSVCDRNKKWTWTFILQKEGKKDFELLLSMICMGEKAKGEMNVMRILPPASPENKKMKPIIKAALQTLSLPWDKVSWDVSFLLQSLSAPGWLWTCVPEWPGMLEHFRSILGRERR
ncbi:unnamed protein product [Gulo gulo]|uniref:Nucleoplasmin core domain-containing protein n=1 Tax=Gulo gulo TaxID=48420 RepID=A0A9X9M5N2_GULGU|nr:unnamed protein product [Gulo gulo]